MLGNHLTAWESHQGHVFACVYKTLSLMAIDTILLTVRNIPMCVQVSFSAGQVVWQERDPTNSQFFIIREGSANLKDAATGAVTSKLGPGKYFGQQSLVGAGAQVSMVCYFWGFFLPTGDITVSKALVLLQPLS